MGEKKLFLEIPKSADFHSVVLTTFSFDFHHFESQVLRQLKKKGVTNVNIFADTAMLDQSIGYATGHLKSLSTSYSINGIPSRGAFHSKITLLAGENDILVLQGSGNITNGGHGKNHELFNVFYANTEDQSQLPLIKETWLYLKYLTQGVEGLSSEKLDWVSNNCNLLRDLNGVDTHKFHKISEEFSTALLYNESSSIWQQLQSLIPSEDVKNIKVFSPFYDEKGLFLNRLNTFFSNSSIDAFLQPDKGIHPFKMDSQKGIRFLSWDSTHRAKDTVAKFQRKLHSKILWFDAGDDQYCLFGSPNATNAAFGTEISRGINDEFGVLIKVKDKAIFEELRLTGDYKVSIPQENIDSQNEEKEIDENQKKNIRRLKLLGVDQDGKVLTLYIDNTSKAKEEICAVYDHWGEEIERQLIKLKGNKIKLELNQPKKLNAVAYIQFIDNESNETSNKQVVNSLHHLWNTNPSVENRRLMKLGSLIESGSSGVFDIIEFYNTIQSSRKLPERKTQGDGGHGDNGDKNEEESSAASLTYEEAIALDKESKEHQHILKQHSSIRIWDSIEKYFKDLAFSEEEEDMDDEEEGDATISRERKEKKPRTAPIPLNSFKVLEKRRKAIEKFLENYSIGLRKSTVEKNHTIGLIDLAMFMIVMKHLIQFTEREVQLKVAIENEDGSQGVLFPLLGDLSQLDSFSGAILNLVGHLINLLFKAPFEEPHDEYTEKKLEHYKKLVRRTALFSLAIAKQSYLNHPNGARWFDLLAFNLLLKLGKPKDELKKELEEFLKNSSIQNLKNDVLLDQIESWVEDIDLAGSGKEYFKDSELGVCYVVKRIPNNGAIKFLKLARPGFNYSHDLNDFVLPELYNYETGELLKSLQKFKKSKLEH